MAENPLSLAWKIATDFSDRRAALPSETEYYKSTFFRSELEWGAYSTYQRAHDKIWEKAPSEPGGLDERELYRLVAYFSVIGFAKLGALLLKEYWLVLAVRSGKATTTSSGSVNKMTTY